MLRRPKHYAQAFRDAAETPEEFGVLVEQFREVVHAIEGDASTRSFFVHRGVPHVRKEKMLHDALRSHVDARVVRFTSIVVVDGQWGSVARIFGALQRLARLESSVHSVVVSSAVVLSSEQRIALSEALTTALHAQPSVDYHVVPGLIGGFRIVMDGTYAWDDSVAGHLDRFHHTLTLE
jgi:F-type H+-transporting ATPase subunit delta